MVDVQIIKTHSKQYETLRRAVSGGEYIFITGQPSVGKTTLAKKVLHEDQDTVFAYVHCNEVTNSSKLFIDICRSFVKNLPKCSFKKEIPSKVMGAPDFVVFYEEFQRYAVKKGYKKLYIVLDQVELLRKTAMLDCVVALDSLFSARLLLTSTEIYTEFLNLIKILAPRVKIGDKLRRVELLAWEKNDLIDVILKQPPRKFAKLYEKFVHNVVTSVYYTNTRNYVEVMMFCKENFENFVEFYRAKAYEYEKKRSNNPDDVTELDDEDLEDFAFDRHYISNVIGSFLESFKNTILKSGMRDWDHLALDRRVVIETTILIISAYIAAYTTHRDDKINFVRFQKKVKRAKVDKTGNDNTPRPFTLERLLQIHRGLKFMAIGEKDYQDNKPSDLPDSVLSDVQMLEDLRLIEVVSGNGLDSLTRYKISNLVSRDYVTRISEQIEYDLSGTYGLS